MRAALDSNVLVSSYLNVSGPSGLIRTALQSQQFEFVVSEELLAEYRRVLGYPRVARLHRMTEEEISEQIAGLREAAVLVPLAEVPNIIPEDPADNDVVATAISGGAAYIVSGDNDLHRLGTYKGIRVVAPALLVELLER